MNALDESTETLPASDPRDAAVNELESMCRELVETVHTLQSTTVDRMAGRLEERIYTMVDAIHAKQRDLYLNHDINVVVAHTREGLPIRVDKVCRKRMWEV